MPITLASSSAAWRAISAADSRMPRVDDVEADVAGGDRDHLGAVRVTVEARLADHHPRPPAARGAAISATRSRTASTAPSSSRSCWPSTPVAGRYSPNTVAQRARPLAGRDAAPARTRSRPARGSRRRARRPRSRASAACTASASRAARVRSQARQRLAGVGVDPEQAAVLAADERRRQTPRCSGCGRPRPARRWRCAPSAPPGSRTSADFISPTRSPRWRRPRARRARSRPRRRRSAPPAAPRTTAEPSNRSGYSSRSVSSARICCRRSDHCWSHGRGSESASFQAGSCSARQRASRDRSTPSVSIRMRQALFSGCSSVRPSELTCTP